MALHVSRASAGSGRRPCLVGRYQDMFRMAKGSRSAQRKRGGRAINTIDNCGRWRWLPLRRRGL